MEEGKRIAGTATKISYKIGTSHCTDGFDYSQPHVGHGMLLEPFSGTGTGKGMAASIEDSLRRRLA